MKDSGFSLVELLVIIAVASVILIAVFDGFSVSLRTSYHALCSSRGAMLAQKYSSMIKAGLSVPATVREGNYVLKLKNRRIPGNREAVIIEVFVGRRKCVELPVK